MTNIIHNIKLQKESLNYLSEVFNQYKEVEFDSNRVYESPIVHMYPVEDTYNEQGELRGFMDKMICTIKIYDTRNKVYSILNNKDAVSCYGENVQIYNIGYFKDGSIIVDYKGDYKIGNYQAIDMVRVN